MHTVTLARHAMATRFEMVLHGNHPTALRAAAEEALDEIERLEAQLSLYQPTSEISRVNARAAAGPVRVEPGMFRLLQRAQRLHAESDGAFDITVAPLMRCWGFMAGTGRLPEPAELAEARAKVGMHLVALDEKDFTVQFTRAGVMLDLGAIGKGYALERAAELLIEAGVTTALLHGGTSTVCALGAPPDSDCWKIAIEKPQPESRGPVGINVAASIERSDRTSLLAVVPLKNESLSVSAVWGKSFEAGGKTYGHVLDPRTGEPVAGALLAAVALPSATETDALSTALLTLGPAGLSQISRLREGMRALALARTEDPGLFQTVVEGIELVEDAGG